MTRRRKRSRNSTQNQWYKVDVHIHTPASSDYQQPDVTILEMLQEAERKGLDIIALTDHNTVAGYRQLQDEIENLELLERLNRLQNDEMHRLKEYRRLLEKLLVLPGFEFTATLGFHILGIFPPNTNVRDLEFLLLELNIPSEKLDTGATDVGATSDVLKAYEVIDEAGGIAIAAHANSNHGVALQGVRFGGQTRIAYTQDPHLHALEVTDLEKRSKRTTARFFDGSKPEYPRRMHCIQGSDSHRLIGDPNDKRHLGLGDRVTEILLPERSFEELRNVFLGEDFTRTRPYRPRASQPFDHIQAARKEGPNIVQEFHEQYSKRGGYLDAIVADVCAFANTNGGTLYIGISDDANKPPVGVGKSATRAINSLQSQIQERITPALNITVDEKESQGVKIARVVVPRGKEPPYTMDDSQIYVRTEAETTLAVRDEIVELVRRGKGAAPTLTPTPKSDPPPQGKGTSKKIGTIDPPRTGVEIANTEDRNKTRYYTMNDLRNNNLVNNVTRRSARNLWRYAIEEAENNPVKPDQVHWVGDLGLWKRRKHRNQTRYDLVQRDGNKIRTYYGVTEEGLHGPWAELIGED